MSWYIYYGNRFIFVGPKLMLECLCWVELGGGNQDERTSTVPFLRYEPMARTDLDLARDKRRSAYAYRHARSRLSGTSASGEWKGDREGLQRVDLRRSKAVNRDFTVIPARSLQRQLH